MYNIGTLGKLYIMVHVVFFWGVDHVKVSVTLHLEQRMCFLALAMVQWDVWWIPAKFWKTRASHFSHSEQQGFRWHKCLGLFASKLNTGWWYTYPSEKYEWKSVGMMTFPIYGKSKKSCSKPPTRTSWTSSSRLVLFGSTGGLRAGFPVVHWRVPSPRLCSTFQQPRLSHSWYIHHQSISSLLYLQTEKAKC